VKLSIWDDFQDFLNGMQPHPHEVLLFSKGADRSFWDMPVLERLFLLFGSETQGLPADILAANPGRAFRIPIQSDIRCLNLSTAVGIVLYESLRVKFVS